MPWSGKTRPNVHEGHGEVLRNFSGMVMHVGTCLTTPSKAYRLRGVVQPD